MMCFKCPYNEFSCPYVDTGSATLDKSCSKECEYYNDGVRSTGATPNLHWFINTVKIMRSAVVKIMMKEAKSIVKINKIHKFYDKWINSDSGFKRFELYLNHPFHFKYKKYFYLNLIPVVAFDLDNQFNNTFHYHDGELHESEIGIGIMLEWLGFKLNFQVNFKTNKPEVKEE